MFPKCKKKGFWVKIIIGKDKDCKLQGENSHGFTHYVGRGFSSGLLDECASPRYSPGLLLFPWPGGEGGVVTND